MAMMSVPRMNEVLELVQEQRDEIRQHQHDKAQIRAEKAEQRKRLYEVGYAMVATSGAALTGYLHGRYEDENGDFFIPRTTIPADMTMGLAGLVAGFGIKIWGDQQKEKGRTRRTRETEVVGECITQAATGMLAGATAMYFRKHAKAGKQANKMWGGVPELMGPQTHNHPRIGAAPVGTSMTDSELAIALRRAL